MNSIFDWLLETTSSASDWIWGPPMVILLFGTGLLLTLMTGFVQIRNFGKAARMVLRGAVKKETTGKGEVGDISPFQALMTALSATVGNGNIAGVATAIATGGPGAAFWMWVTALVGMATKYAEAVLAIRFRLKMEDGTMAGGPMYYCKHGIKNRHFGAFLGAFFAICGGIATLFGTGNMFQSQQIALAAKQQFGFPPWTMGLLISFLVGLVILGGVRRIGAVAERLVPAMIVFYFAGALLVILTNLPQVPAALALIFTSAFSPQAAFGGAVGIGIQQAIRFGVARGVLSNESGLGSAAIAHGAARTRYPVAQGTIAMMGTFIDTIVVCSLTAITITVSGAYQKAIFMVGPDGLGDSNLTVYAFNTGMPAAIAGWGGVIVVVASLIFGFTTLIGWSYYGQICFEYLFGLKIVKPYRVVFIILLFAGALFTGPRAPIIKNVGDICNAFMAFPNLIGLILLSGIVSKMTRDAYRAGHLNVHEATPIEHRE
ncbi:MAG: alanine/glycine:cation symporter family protein [Acidobacteriota bacterium]